MIYNMVLSKVGNKCSDSLDEYSKEMEVKTIAIILHWNLILVDFCLGFQSKTGGTFMATAWMSTVKRWK